MQPRFWKRSALLLPALAAMLLMLCACGSQTGRSGEGGGLVSFTDNLRTRFYAKQTSETYIDKVNGGLVSFTDCVNALTDSLHAIEDSQKVPSDAQLTAIENAQEQLHTACQRLAAIEAPENYTEQQAALTDAMVKYETALEKCRALTDFYRGYDDAMHSYKTPAEGSKELETQMTALYADFTDAMWQARQSLRDAQAKFQE